MLLLLDDGGEKSVVHGLGLLHSSNNKSQGTSFAWGKKRTEIMHSTVRCVAGLRLGAKRSKSSE